MTYNSKVNDIVNNQEQSKKGGKRNHASHEPFTGHQESPEIDFDDWADEFEARYGIRPTQQKYSKPREV